MLQLHENTVTMEAKKKFYFICSVFSVIPHTHSMLLTQLAVDQKSNLYKLMHCAYKLKIRNSSYPEEII